MTPIERESLRIDLYSALTNAYGNYSTARLEVGRLRTDVIPRLRRLRRPPSTRGKPVRSAIWSGRSCRRNAWKPACASCKWPSMHKLP